MKYWRIVVLILIFAIISLGACFAFSNLVGNPSFETGGDVPDGWGSWFQNGATCEFNWEDSVAHTGSRSVSISNFQGGTGDGIWGTSQSPAIVPGKAHVLSAWVKAENLTSGQVLIFCWDGARGKAYSSTSIKESTNGWKQLFMIVQMGTNTGDISFELRVNAINPEAKIYFDDAACYPLPDNQLWLENASHSDSTPENRIVVDYPFPNATAGFMNYQPPGAEQWSAMNFESIRDFKGFDKGTYRFVARYYGDPGNSGSQAFYLNGWSNDSRVIPVQTDGQFHYFTETFEVDSDGYIPAPVIKKWGPTNQGTNPVDWIWVGPDGTESLEEEMVITEAPILTADTTVPGQVTLSWTEPASRSGIAVYQIYRGLTADFDPKDGVVVANTKETGYTEVLDTTHDYYYYKVLAWNDIYNSSPTSNEVRIASFSTDPYQNLMPDPSFEQAAWPENNFSNATANLAWDSTTAHTGEKSLSISNFSGSGFAAWKKIVNLKGNQTYQLNVWTKIENLTQGSVVLYCYENGNNQTTFSIGLTADTQGWQQMGARIALPASATAILIELRANGINQDAKVYFDDFALYQVPKGYLWLENASHDNGFAVNYPHPAATGGYMTYQPPGAGQWSKMSYQSTSNFVGFAEGTYKVVIRYFGDPDNNGDQAFYLDGWSNDARKIPSFSDGKFHTFECTFDVASDNFIPSPCLKKWGPTERGTNPIDWIWIGLPDENPPEEEQGILEAPVLSADTTKPGEVTLSWTQPASTTGIGAYQLYRSSTADFTLDQADLLLSTAANTYTEELDQEEGFYYYKVIAWNMLYSGFGSHPSDEVKVLRDNIPPGAPENVLASNEIPGLVLLSWNPPQETAGDLAAGYLIFRAQEGADFGEIPYAIITSEDPMFSADPASKVQWRDKDVQPEVEYSYAVAAVDHAGNQSAFSEKTTVVPTEDDIPPNPPTSITVKNDEILGALVLSWPTPSPAERDEDLPERYIIYKSLSESPKVSWQEPGGNRFEVEAAEGSQQYYLDTKIEPGKTYYYAVESVDKMGNCSENAVESEGTLVLEPYKAEPVSPLEGMGVVDIAPTFSWEAPKAYAGDTLKGYYVRVARDIDFTTELLESGFMSKETLSYRLPVILDEGDWYWQVKVEYESGVVSYSDAQKFTSVINGANGLGIAYLKVSPQVFNPNHGDLLINYVIKEDSYVTVRIYDLKGRLIKTLVENELQMATDEQGQLRSWQLVWSGQGSRTAVPRGLYLLKVEARPASGRPVHMVQKFQIVR